MATTKQDAVQEVKSLVEQYQSLDEKSIKKYSEADTRRVFILPLFKALGWDVYSREEVTEEERASRGRVDYAFHIRGIPKFFLEAKSLRADLDNPDYAKQVVNYAYHKEVTWAVLTDFEGVKVFNAEWKGTDIARAPRLELSWQQYLERFDRLWLLSREAFEEGLLDKEAEGWGIKIKKTPVGQQLFSDLVAWRGVLHKYLSAYNKKRATYQIDEAVQRILDRLIFIRTCEDRQIEPHILRPLVREWRNGARKDLIRDLREIWEGFNDGYDSRLFLPHLADELDCEATPFEEVIEGLYATKDGAIEYDFNAINADVLGGIYEQYLEHLLRRAGEEVEVIPERGKRKARGIYYTPKFVVRYIVENTLGRALEGKSLNEARTIRILDPACGSGSFLVEALDYLEKHWRRQGWVQEGGEQADFFDYLARVQFLTDNLFGVDLDAQAVEIAQLNLLLRSAHQRALLPDLKNNIRQGNSLISGTEAELRPYFGDSWQDKKPFNWQKEFDRVMAEGGFDVVIGNPPYGADFDEDDRDYIEDHYPYSKSNKNSAMVFIERALSLTRENGFFSFIIPKSLAFSQKWASGRKLVLDDLGVACDATKAFKEVLLEQMIVVVSKKFSSEPCYKATSLHEEREKAWASIPKQVSNITDSILLGVTDMELAIFNKVTSPNLIMGDISKTARGLPFQRHVTKDAEAVPVYRGDHIARYTLHETTETLPEAVLTGAKKKVAFLHQPKILTQRIVAHVLHPFDHIILMSVLDKEGVLTLDTVENTVITDKTFAYGFITALLNSKFLSWYAYRFIFSKAIRTMDVDDYYLGKLPVPRIDFENATEKQMHDDLVALVEWMLELNKRLAPIRNTPCNERDELKREIERTDRQIDNLVYDLYGLTEEERRIVEESV